MVKTTPMSVEKAMKIAQGYNSKISFQKGSYWAYKYLLQRPKYFKVATKHMTNPLKHSFEVIAKEALKYKKAVDFQTYSKWAYCCAQQNGWLEKVCSHMEKRFVWDITSASKEAKKYKMMNEFRLNSRGAYNFLKRNGNQTLMKACSHMEKAFKWTAPMAIKKAKQYPNKQLLREADFACYAYILRAKIHKEAFAHMTETIIQSEKFELENFIEQFSHKLKKKKIKFKIHKEYHLIAGKRYRVDLLVDFYEWNQKIAIEFKSDRCYWNKAKIEKQISFYKKHLEKFGVHKIYLLSTKGKYGISCEEFYKEFFKD